MPLSTQVVYRGPGNTAGLTVRGEWYCPDGSGCVGLPLGDDVDAEARSQGYVPVHELPIEGEAPAELPPVVTEPAPEPEKPKGGKRVK